MPSQDFDNVLDALRMRARATPDAVAYSVGGEAIAYVDLARDSRVIAAGLRAGGCGAGDRAAVVLGTSLDCVRTIFGILWAGAAPAVLDPALPTSALATRLRILRPAVIITDEACAPAVCLASGAATPPVLIVRSLGEARVGFDPAPVDSSAPVFFQFTSGTTGEPRAGMIAHASLMASLASSARRFEITPRDVFATLAPLHHVFGLARYVFGAMVAGCASHLTRPSLGALETWLRSMTQVQATFTGGADSAFRHAARLVDPRGIDLGSLRVAVSASESVRASSLQAFADRFGVRPGVLNASYGLTEATLSVTAHAAGALVRTDADGTVSCGRPLDAFALRILSDAGDPCPAGEPGHIVIRGAPVFDGYFGDVAATRAVLRDGWLHTGDVGSVDAEGHVYVTARRRLLIKRGGHAIAPREIEEAVDRLAGLVASAAIGLPLDSAPDSDEHVVVVAEIDASRAHAPEALTAAVDLAVRSAIGISPGLVVLVSPGGIPRTASGKVEHLRLRDALRDGQLDPFVIYRR